MIEVMLWILAGEQAVNYVVTPSPCRILCVPCKIISSMASSGYTSLLKKRGL
ncbi:hypothetical protein PAXRUDRAFT_824146 [Paxillus rubicundulus Ve08.2h10]|uniref:Uncharacterized protein n=1 Tax=Paxillus rubicundulus Ve08.2h10 TaxID=930991 RepID=A0A0D0DUQ7_9AGAM|nr:hypothetical protein PAXRUDRAFT_824146 [Paxillus rubicundulus Ve08.2h10]